MVLYSSFYSIHAVPFCSLLTSSSPQVDVLETQFSIFIDKIRTTHDFETIKRAQEHFLAMLHSQLFFSQPDQVCLYVCMYVHACMSV